MYAFGIFYLPTSLTINAPVRHIPAWFPGMHAKRVATNGSALRQKMGEKFLADILDSKVQFLPSVTALLVIPVPVLHIDIGGGEQLARCSCSR
jgi:hypothetical protein